MWTGGSPPRWGSPGTSSSAGCGSPGSRCGAAGSWRGSATSSPRCCRCFEGPCGVGAASSSKLLNPVCAGGTERGQVLSRCRRATDWWGDTPGYTHRHTHHTHNCLKTTGVRMTCRRADWPEAAAALQPLFCVCVCVGGGGGGVSRKTRGGLMEEWTAPWHETGLLPLTGLDPCAGTVPALTARWWCRVF